MDGLEFELGKQLTFYMMLKAFVRSIQRIDPQSGGGQRTHRMTFVMPRRPVRLRREDMLDPGPALSRFFALQPGRPGNLAR